jgi:hypothetical protein
VIVIVLVFVTMFCSVAEIRGHRCSRGRQCRSQ